ncbi:ATP-dependent RNA helicase DEAH12, chloroplastic-like [Lingula anatina]|uniref:RNA helicase n=1 Tax=Lingula anatina TaxID=7574 RepID=A0A1S3HD20_LINAN|nr:ATP-dependent RNA helicase DEAH12, chloroplastic-like [Lingula anatina]XP_013383427.1 ATP-dependent RNA helicase DEAH12, chloroplastic-like [Lingula anatina]|eukprot:XP_013383426.1 ATP-dependent RNA helicase DEAH12, chloroplastic-like [Lingula anatina]
MSSDRSDFKSVKSPNTDQVPSLAGTYGGKKTLDKGKRLLKPSYRQNDPQQLVPPSTSNVVYPPRTRKKNKKHEDNSKTTLQTDARISPKARKPIPAEVLVKLKEKILLNDEERVKPYFQHIMSQTIDFEAKLVSEMASDSSTQVLLVFPSKNLAKRALSSLQKLIHVKDSTIESVKFKQCNEDTDETKALLQKQEIEVQEKGDKLLDEHSKKISEVANLLKKTHVQRHVPLAEYERITSEKAALQDKLSELNNQKKEFADFLKMTKNHFREIQPSKHFHEDIFEIRKAFGRECHKLTSALPMYARRGDILNTVMNNQVSVILGETGSGKSTQLVQYLHQVGLGKKGIIACTQPRKVAAISLARHVSSEMGCAVGGEVGFQVGMQKKRGPNTSIIYMTDHVLLNECLKDNLLNCYSVIIIDEAHERSIHTDLLIGMVKSCLKQRPELKVIITSATIDPDVFVSYFGGCPVLQVSGRTFPVEVVWKDTPRQPNSDHVRETVVKAIAVHQTEPEGDILAFLTSPTETEKASVILEAQLPFPDEVICLQLHGRLQSDEQNKVFEQTPVGKRKIVFATNSAETSITIPGIKYVIDSGLVKEVRYDPKKNRSSLDVVTVNQSSAEQRKGRAGRISSGKCFRLYTKEEYESSERISTPEILRVHVSGALLKLLEIGIPNPLEFDYVQPPPLEALEYGMRSLRELGAVDDQGITEVGKQMAKLPLEPHLSRLVLLGIEEGIGFEALVLAAVTSTSSNIFFRKGTEDEKEMADKLKTTFCHQGGDSVTFVNVYREWNKIPDKQKSRWCVGNFINARAMRCSRDAVQEMIKIVKSEIGLKVPYAFHSEEEMVQKLPPILFKTYGARHLCLYLGHSKAGYLVARLGQAVQIHPSSALKYLGSSPKWLVYQSLLSTSQDFAMNLTPVEEGLVVEATESGLLNIDLEQLEAQTLSAVSLFFGRELMLKLIGPKFSTLCGLQKKISAEIGGGMVIIDPIRVTGEVKVYCQTSGHDTAVEMIARHLECEKEKLREETCELPLHHSPGSVHAILGCGGQTRWILMPEQYTTVVIVTKGEEKPSTHDIIEKFSMFGKIVSHFEFKKNNSANVKWGKITFRNPESASQAVNKTSGLSISARPGTSVGIDSKMQEYKMRLQWCRRPTRGFGFVNFKDIDDYILASSSTQVLRVGTSYAKLRPGKGKPNEIFISNLDKNVDETQLLSALKDAFPAAVIIDRVSIPREKPFSTTQEQMNAFRHQLSIQIEALVDKRHFQLDLLKPKDKDYFFIGYLTFKSSTDGQAVHNALRRNLLIGERPVSMEALLFTSILVQKEVYQIFKDDIKEATADLIKGSEKLNIKESERRDGNFTIDIRADNVADLREAKMVIHEITQGDILDCSISELMRRNLLSFTSKDILKRIMSSSGTYILADRRMSSLAIYGSERARTVAKIEINKYLDDMVSQKVCDIPLSSSDRPPGVMKALMQTYGLDLQRLTQETGATHLKLDLRHHTLCFQGTDDAFNKLEQAVQACIDGLPNKPTVKENSIDCVVCFCPIDDSVFRIECCGHPYCQECITNQIRVAIEEKNFPITCAQEGCEELIEWRTLNKLTTEPMKRALVASSTMAFVSKAPEAYTYCGTPDCPMVYQITENGKPFTCCNCQVTTCTTCKIEYHQGLSCAMYQGMKRDKNISLKVWLEKDPQNRRKCPQCKAPIEKNGGCNHMTCLSCKKHICWQCNAIFDSGTVCYDHLTRCGGIFPNNM